MKTLFKKLTIILFLIPVLLTSCDINTLRGKKLYLLSLTVNSVPMMKEMECNFISPDKVEIRLTVFGYLGEFKTYVSDPTIYNESKILTYSFKDGFLEIPELNVTAKLTEDSLGNYQTNTNETFYTQSIVKILNTQEAKDRILKASPMANIADMYLDMLKNPSNDSPLIKKNGQWVFRGYINNQSTNTDGAERDSAAMADMEKARDSTAMADSAYAGHAYNNQ
jgi:hypothetical protein